MKPAKADLFMVVLFIFLLMSPIFLRPEQLFRCLFVQTSLGIASPRDLASISDTVPTVFPYRKQLLRGYNSFRFQAFGLPPRSVLIGQNGWLFYDADLAHDDGLGMADFLGLDLPSPDTLTTWRSEAQLRQEWFTSRHIEYLLVIAPNKQSLYPENLPLRYVAGKAQRTSIDAGMEAMRSTFTLDPIFLLPHFLRTTPASGERLYLQTDTHWNSLGAWAAYTSIIAALPALKKATPIIIDTWRHEQRDWSGDIAAMALMQETWREKALVLLPDRDYPAVYKGTAIRLLADHQALWQGDQNARPQPETTSKGDSTFTTEIADPSLPSALVFSDSFGDAIAPFLAQHFRSCQFIRGRLDADLIASVKPDVVIQLRVERYLDKAFEPLLRNGTTANQ